jgi:hypothetical protein
MTLQPNPNSKRSIKRAKRRFTMSRPNRRAEKRLLQATNCYLIDCSIDKSNGSTAYTKPGSQKHW